MSPPIEWLESCHAVASVKVDSRPFNTYFEKKILPGNPALFAAFHPVYLEGQMDGSEWFLYIPKPESFPTNRENVHVIPGNQTSYMVTVRGTLSQKMGPGVNVPVKQPQHLTRFYIWEEGEGPQEFLLQVMLTKKEYDYLNPIQTRGVLRYLAKLSPYFPLNSLNVSNVKVYYSVLLDNQFLEEKLWFAYHPFYVQPQRESGGDNDYYHMVYGKKAGEVSMFTPLEYVTGKKSSFKSFPREIVSCERAQPEPPSDISVYEPKEKEFSDQIAEQERVEYNRNAFYKRVGIEIYSQKSVNLLQLGLNQLFQTNPRKKILRTNLFKILNFPDKSKPTLQKQYLGFVEEIRSERESGDGGSDDSGNNWEGVKYIIKRIQSLVGSILNGVDYSTFPIITDFLQAKLNNFKFEFRYGGDGDRLLVRLDLTKLYDPPPPPYKVDYRRLHKMLPFAQTAQGMLEEAQREWKRGMVEPSFRTAGVRPDPNFGYWPAETSQHLALKCGSFFCT